MRTSWIAGIVAASLGLSACGATATIHSAVASLGSTPDVQMHLTASVSGPGSAEAQQVLSQLSVDVDYSNPTGAALSQASGAVDTDITVNLGAKTLTDLREVAGNVYVMVDVSALSSIPTLNLSTSELNALELLIGQRWFEFQKGFIDSSLLHARATPQETSKEQAAAKRILDALSKLINTTPYTTTASGAFSETGSLNSVVTAVLPTIESVEGTTLHPGAVPGTYTVTLATSGSTATGASVTITAPDGTRGNESVSLNAAVTHNNDAVSAPSGATIITQSLLKGLLSQAS